MARDEWRPADQALVYARERLAAAGSVVHLGTGSHGWVSPASEHSALILGPPRSGKTSAVVIPSVVAAPGAVVATSTKTDVVEVTRSARARYGRCWVFDPGGDPVPPGTTQLRWSPVVSARSWDEAVLTAHALVTTRFPPGTPNDSSHWSERAEALLAPLLHAASLSGADIAAVARWVHRREDARALRILSDQRAELATDVLTGIAETDERERSGIFSTASGVLAPYRSESVARAGATPNFDPRRFVEDADTVYVRCPAATQEALAPIVVALLEAVTRAAYARHPAGPPLLFALDELANIAPLPGLPSIVSEGGSQGLVTLACLQDLSQARRRWGDLADGFLTLFGAKLIMPGVGDLRTLQVLSALAGQVEEPTRSETRRHLWSLRGSVTSTTRRVPRLPVDAISRGRPGQALLLDGADPPSWVELTPWYATSPWREAVSPTTVSAGSAPG
jgi:type IV secretion system protein VirD4